MTVELKKRRFLVDYIVYGTVIGGRFFSSINCKNLNGGIFLIQNDQKSVVHETQRSVNSFPLRTHFFTDFNGSEGFVVLAY